MEVYSVCFVWNKDGDGSKELESLHSEKLKVVQLDVCSEEQVSQALQFVTVNLDDPRKVRDVWLIEDGEFKGHSGGPDHLMENGDILVLFIHC